MSKKAAAPTDPPDAIRRYGLYRRVSDASQVEQDLSLPAQRRLQHEYVSRLGGVAVAEFEDGGVSGTKSDNRQGFQDAIAAARRREFDVLLIHKSDRVFRNRFDAVTYKVLLKEHGVALESVTEPWVGGDEPGERLLEGVMECVNEFYSANLSREVKKGLEQIAVAHGRQSGQAPYGYDYANIQVQGSGWVVREEEAVWVRRAFRRVLEGASVAEIVREMNAAGVPTYNASPRGRSQNRKGTYQPHWTGPVLRGMLLNPVYAGDIVRNGRSLPGAHEAVIDRETFDAAQARMHRRPGGRADQSERGLFVGRLARCPHCGGVLMHVANKQGRVNGARGGEEYNSRYFCLGGYMRWRAQRAEAQVEGCAGFYISQKMLRGLLVAKLSGLAGAFAARVPSATRPRPGPARNTSGRGAGDEKARFEEQLGKLERMRQGYIDVAAEGMLRMDELRGRLEDLERRRAEICALLSALQEPARPAALTPDQAASLLGALADPQRTVRDQRDALRQFIDYVTPWPGRDGLDVYLLY